MSGIVHAAKIDSIGLITYGDTAKERVMLRCPECRAELEYRGGTILTISCPLFDKERKVPAKIYKCTYCGKTLYELEDDHI
jgi:hypothetical protein